MGHLLADRPITTLEEYLDRGVGGRGLERAVAIGPDATIDEVLRSGLRGRGGGGFLTGRKWAGVRGQAGMGTGMRRYVVANGAEGEPGTFKDRALLRANPYQLVEGVMVAAFAVGAAEAFIAVKASFTREADGLTRAVQELQAAGICHDCSVTIVRGPEDYLFGEETALLEVIEGNAALPRLLRPYEHGLFGHPGRYEPNPTAVNNVETLSNVPHVLLHGADWFRSMGTPESPGTIVCTVVGDTQRASVGEVVLGTPLRSVIDDVGGGVVDGRSVKAVFSGVANPVLPGALLDTPVSYEGFAAAGSGMGAGGFIVLDDTACMVEAARLYSRFLAIESCGQCPACKRGSTEITELLTRIEGGAGSEHDVSEIGAWLGKVTDGNRCYLAVEERELVASVLRTFPGEVDEHLSLGECPRPRPLPLPLVVDIDDGRVTYGTFRA